MSSYPQRQLAPTGVHPGKGLCGHPAETHLLQPTPSALRTHSTLVIPIQVSQIEHNVFKHIFCDIESQAT